MVWHLFLYLYCFSQHIGAYCVFLGLIAFLSTWLNKKNIFRSSMESKYYAMVFTTNELLWLRSSFSKLKLLIVTYPTLFRDSESAKCLVENPTQHTCNKLIKLDPHFIRDQVLQHQLLLTFLQCYCLLINFTLIGPKLWLRSLFWRGLLVFFNFYLLTQIPSVFLKYHKYP